MLQPPKTTSSAALLILIILAWLLLRPAQAAPSYAVIREHLIQYEGYRTRPYRDGPGWSVGVGHSLTANREHGIWHRPYTTHEIEQHLAADVSWALDACRAGVINFDYLPDPVQLAAISVAFGVGRTGFARMISFRSALSRRNYYAAVIALGGYKWATDVQVARVERVRELVLEGERS